MDINKKIHAIRMLIKGKSLSEARKVMADLGGQIFKNQQFDLLEVLIEFEEGNLEIALGKIHAHISSYGEGFEAFNLAARIELGLKNYDQALAWVDKSLALKNDVPMSHIIKHQIYVTKNCREKALIVAREFVTILPNNASSQIRFCEDLVLLRKYNEFWEKAPQAISVVSAKDKKLCSLAITSLCQYLEDIVATPSPEAAIRIDFFFNDRVLSSELAQDAEVHKAASTISSILHSITKGRTPHFLEIINSGGSLAHYNHFFGSFILPFLEAVENRMLPEKAVFLLPDVGPMIPEVEDLFRNYDVEAIYLPRSFDLALRKNMLLSTNFQKTILPAYDCYWVDGYWAPNFAVIQARMALKRIADQSYYKGVETNRRATITFVDRKPPTHSFYIDNKRTSGSQRRSIPNATAIATRLEQLPDVLVNFISFEGMGLIDKFNLMRETKIFIVQHGAGLTAMYWMSPGATVIELVPNNLNLKRLSVRNDDIARDTFHAGQVLAERMKLKYLRVIQPGPHEPVNPEVLFNLCSLIIEKMGSSGFPEDNWVTSVNVV